MRFWVVEITWSNLQRRVMWITMGLWAWFSGKVCRVWVRIKEEDAKMKFLNSILNVHQAARLIYWFSAMGVNETFKMKAFMERSLVMVNVGLKGTLGPKDFCFCLPDASGKRIPLSHSLLHGLLGPCASVLPFCILDAFTRVVFFP